jgi:hypothetical protein
MKNLVKLSTIAGFLFLFSCTAQDDITTEEAVDPSLLITTEFLLVPSTDTTSSDSTRGCGKGHGRGKGGHGLGHASGAQADTITLAGLPQTAQTYIATNASTLTISIVLKITLADGTIRYAVRFTDGTHYHFDASGTVIVKPAHIHNFAGVTFDSLPAAARTYLLANTDTTLINHIVKIVQKDGTILYGVRLNNNTHYYFDANGTIVAAPRRRRK